MAQSKHIGDLYVDGTLTPKGLIPPDDCLGDDAWPLGDPLDAEKQVQRHNLLHSQGVAVDAADEAVVLYRCNSADGAAIVKLAAGIVTAAAGAATVTVDLKKNGSTILSAVITIDNSIAAYEAVEPAGYTSTALIEDDVLTIHIDETIGGGTRPKGVWVELIVDEQPN